MDKLEMAFKALNNASDREIYEYSKNIPPIKLQELLNKLTVLRKRLQKDMNTWGPIEKMGKVESLPAIHNENVVEEELKTVEWVADYLKLSDVTIYKHIKKGKIHAIKVGNKYRVPISQFKI